MSDLGPRGGVAGAHEAQPFTGDVPRGVAVTKAPKGQVHFGVHSKGIGGSKRPAR